MVLVKKQRNYRKKSTTLENDEAEQSPMNDTLETQSEDNVIDAIAELQEIRQLRRKHGGVDAEKLFKGQDKKKKTGKSDKSDGNSKSGGLVEKDAYRSGRSAEEEETRNKTLKLDTFTSQTNALDVNKHMMEYIEAEMRKRKGVISDGDDERETKPQGFVDIYEELYRLPDKSQGGKKLLQEGSVQLSTQMLTAIPEVDLGIDAQLKNIEDTERAKRKLLDQRHDSGDHPKKKSSDLEDVPANFEKQILKKDKPKNNNRRQMATDDIVAERFKKRMRHQ